MVSFFERVLEHPNYYRQFNCGDSLITAFNCPMEARLMKTRFADLWTKHNYLFYVIDGRKIWHTANGAFDIGKDSCVFVKKGGFILEQFSETGFCVMLFFIPDDFISGTLRSRSKPVLKNDRQHKSVIMLETGNILKGFFLSMSGYFEEHQNPDPSVLELKFKELIFNIADDPANQELSSYFCSLLSDPLDQQLKRVMEDNFCFNLKLSVYAELCNRSLSSFKRDFEKIFNTTPGKWLLEKRLQHASDLISNRNKTVGEAAFESGFQSPSHFSRAFHLRFAKKPSAMKALANNETALILQ